MNFSETTIAGAYLITPKSHDDPRGSFSRLFCADTFANHGLEPRVCQANHSYSRKRGTLRGMHYQLPPREETKLVRCIAGAVYDVIIDLREASPSYRQWFGAELSPTNGAMMYVPRGCAHGFFTLEAHSEILYWVSENYAPDFERGIRWDDPTFAIAWPGTPHVISSRDASHPLYDVGVPT